MDRDERLKAAKEKLKQFQQKRHKDTTSTNGDDSSSEPRMSPFTTSANHDNVAAASSSHSRKTSNGGGDLPVFTMSSNNSYVPIVDTATMFDDVPTLSSAETTPLSTVGSSPAHAAGGAAGGLTTTDFEKISTILDELDRTKQAKAELERQLLVQSASIKQYDVYCQSLASELTTCQATLEKERKDNRTAHESESVSLRAQLQSHAESIKILVAEKADFEATVHKLHVEVASKNVELQRLQLAVNGEAEANKRDELRRAEQLSEEINQLRQELNLSHQQADDLKQEVAELVSKINSKDKTCESLRSELAAKTSKLEMVELNLSQLRAAKDVDEIRREEAQRLAEKEEELSRVIAENAEHVQRVSELTAYIHQASVDREQIIHQYTSYSQQLAAQIESLTQQLNERAAESHGLAAREKELVGHVQHLEAQLQKLIHQQQQQVELTQQSASVDANKSASNGSSDASRSDELVILRQQVTLLDAKVRELLEERGQLNEDVKTKNHQLAEVTSLLTMRNETIKDLETQLEMTRSNASADVISSDLMAACQSDKVAASRAMTQNKQLKEQLDELQMAIVQLTNTKADLMSELDAYKTTRAQQDKDEATMKMEIRGLHAALAERDRNLNHMREQMKYYIAFAENSISGNLDSGPRKQEPEEQIKELIAKLQLAQEEIRSLNSHNSELRSQLEVLSSRTRESSETPELHGDDSAATTSPPPTSADGHSPSESPRPPPSPAPSSTSSSSLTSSSTQNSVTAASHETKNNESTPTRQQLRPDVIPPLSQDVALLKLEQKFRQAMARIEELLNEKEHLEHVVVQLQEETETVGEYITIYQYQRQQQRRRLEENERQLQLVSRDREELKSKLSQLQALVTSFVTDTTKPEIEPAGNTTVNGRGTSGSSFNGDLEIGEDALHRESSLRPSEKSAVISPTRQAINTNYATTVDLTEPLAPIIVSPNAAATPTAVTPVHHASMPHPSSPSKADKILALISEIGANQMLNNIEDFQPWFWEHSPGKLINI